LTFSHLGALHPIKLGCGVTALDHEDASCHHSHQSELPKISDFGRSTIVSDWHHTFRATGITAYLGNGGTLEHAQSMAGHESPRTTKLYDRTKERLTQDEVERIRL
jgi:hypothetical protein